MKMKVLGKMHRAGTSRKTGNAYDFIQLHYLGKEPGVEGQAACTVNIDPGLLPYEDVKIGADYNVEYGPRGYVTGFSAV